MWFWKMCHFYHETRRQSGSFRPGCFAEYVCAAANLVLRLPEILSPRTRAATMLQGLTAWTLIRKAHEVKKDEFILVQAAAGGTGGLIAQMAHHLMARVIGTAYSTERCNVAKINGCYFVINYKTNDLVEEVMRLTGGLGCHAVSSRIGQATFEQDLRNTGERVPWWRTETPADRCLLSKYSD